MKHTEEGLSGEGRVQSDGTVPGPGRTARYLPWHIPAHMFVLLKLRAPVLFDRLDTCFGVWERGVGESHEWPSYREGMSQPWRAL